MNHQDRDTAIDRDLSWQRRYLLGGAVIMLLATLALLCTSSTRADGQLIALRLLLVLVALLAWPIAGTLLDLFSPRRDPSTAASPAHHARATTRTRSPVPPSPSTSAAPRVAQTMDHAFIRSAIRIPEQLQLWLASETPYAIDLSIGESHLSDEVFTALWHHPEVASHYRPNLIARLLGPVARRLVLDASDLDAYDLEGFLRANRSLDRADILALGRDKITPEAASSLQLTNTNDPELQALLDPLAANAQRGGFRLNYTIPRSLLNPADLDDAQRSLGEVLRHRERDFAPLVVDRLGSNPERWAYWLSMLSTIDPSVTLARALETTVSLCELHQLPKDAATPEPAT